MEFVFGQIFDQTQPMSMRSAFCNLALTVYVDREPYNPLIVPNLCRLINPQQPLPPPKNYSMNQWNKSIESLIDYTFQYIFTTSESLHLDMVRRAKVTKKDTSAQNVEEQNGNQLTFDILKLTKTLIQCHIFAITGQKDKLYNILPPLIELLEYDRINMVIPYVLYGLRQEARRVSEQRKSKLQMTFSKAKTIVGVAVEGMVDLAKFVAYYLSGKKKEKEGLEEEFAEYQTTLISKNPIISSLITITNHVQSFVQDFDQQNSVYSRTEIEIKHQICDIIIFFQELRLDYLISNFICFFNERGTALNFNSKKVITIEQIHEMMLREIITVIPPRLRTGIEEVDNKIKVTENNIFSAVGDFMSSINNMMKKEK